MSLYTRFTCIFSWNCGKFGEKSNTHILIGILLLCVCVCVCVSVGIVAGAIKKRNTHNYHTTLCVFVILYQFQVYFH